MSKMMKRGIFMFLLLLAVSIGIIYYTIDLDALKTISSFNSISFLIEIKLADYNYCPLFFHYSKAYVPLSQMIFYS